MAPPSRPASSVPDMRCNESIPLACSETLRQITAQCATLHEGQEALGAKLDVVSKAVLGNGTIRDSLVARVVRLESASETVRQCGDRFWRVFAILVALASAVIAFFK
jgi:hypothetical protein